MTNDEMNDLPLDLRKLEKKAFRSTFDDGFWDIFLGMIIMGLGLGPLFLIEGLTYPWDALLFPLMWNCITLAIFFGGKKFITVPRMGTVKFGKKRKTKKIKLKFFLLLMFIINLILFVLLSNDLIIIGQVDRYMFPLFFGILLFTFPLSIVAYFLDFNRLFGIALAGGLGFFLTELLYPHVGSPLDFILVFGLMGAIIILIGITIFIKFLKSHPLPKLISLEEESPIE